MELPHHLYCWHLKDFITFDSFDLLANFQFAKLRDYSESVSYHLCLVWILYRGVKSKVIFSYWHCEKMGSSTWHQWNAYLFDSRTLECTSAGLKMDWYWRGLALLYYSKLSYFHFASGLTVIKTFHYAYSVLYHRSINLSLFSCHLLDLSIAPTHLCKYLS